MPPVVKLTRQTAARRQHPGPSIYLLLGSKPSQVVIQTASQHQQANSHSNSKPMVNCPRAHTQLSPNSPACGASCCLSIKVHSSNHLPATRACKPTTLYTNSITATASKRSIVSELSCLWCQLLLVKAVFTKESCPHLQQHTPSTQAAHSGISMQFKQLNS